MELYGITAQSPVYNLSSECFSTESYSPVYGMLTVELESSRSGAPGLLLI